MKAVLFALCVFAASASAAPQRFVIEAELEQARLYVGGETIMRVRLARAPGMPYGILRPPPIGDAFEIWSLGPARWFQVEREGVPWDVHERAYLLIPRRGGTVTIPGAASLRADATRAAAYSERRVSTRPFRVVESSSSTRMTGIPPSVLRRPGGRGTA